MSLEDEICESKYVPVITPISFKNNQFFQIECGAWNFIEDMTPVEKDSVSKEFGQRVKPPPISPKSAPPPSLLDYIPTLDECVYEL